MVKKAARIITPPVPVTQVPVTAPAPAPAAVEILPSTQLGKRTRDEEPPIFTELDVVKAVLKYSAATDAEKVALLTDEATCRVMMHAAKLTSQCNK